MAILSLTLACFPVVASSSVVAIDSVEAANQAVASEGGKEILNVVVKVARSKPALSAATAITCIACIPGLCIACGILISRTLG